MLIIFKLRREKRKNFSCNRKKNRQEDGVKKNFNHEIIHSIKLKPLGVIYPGQKTPINRNFDIRKMAEERATKDLKISKEDKALQQKKKLK